jgi:hypothetical protein
MLESCIGSGRRAMLDWIMLIILMVLICGVPGLLLEGLREFFPLLKSMKEGGKKG